MEVEIREFQGIIIRLDSIIEQLIKGPYTYNLDGTKNIKTMNVISYEITLYIKDKDATIKLENVRPEEIKILKKQSDYIKELEKFKKGEY